MSLARRDFCTLALLTRRAFAQDLTEQVRSLRPPDSAASKAAVLDNLESRARRALESLRHPRSQSDAAAARTELRRRLAHSLGHRRLPWPPSLNVRSAGMLEGDGYRVEKIIFETLPGVDVPAHLYLPASLAGRVPAILFYPGHWWPDSKSRPEFQAFCLNMARLGLMVLSFDPFGQGERGVSSRDHRRTESLLVGVSQQGFAEYETQCALEYLLSRPEADPERIGMTGASGGGYNTWITAALDDRIKVAVPVVGTSEFFDQILAVRRLDWYGAREHCHFPAGLIRYANNHELLAMIAPRPLMIISATVDQSFPAAGVRQVAEYGRELYRAHGAEQRVAHFEDAASGHDYAQRKREAAYGWFLKWLMGRGDGSPYAEPATRPPAYDAPELRCFPAGQNRSAGPGMHAAVRKLAANTSLRHPRTDLEAILGALPPRPASQPPVERVRVQRLVFRSEAGLDCPAFLLMPDEREPLRGTVIAADDAGKEALSADPVIQRLLREGWSVCGMDPRGIGEMAAAETGWIFGVSLLLNENFVWRQAWDLRVAAQRFAGKPVGIYARGHNASLAAIYTAAQLQNVNRRSPAWIAIRDGFVSFRHFIDRPENQELSYRLLAENRREPGGFDREIPLAYFAFEALRRFDLPDLLAPMASRTAVINPIGGDWRQLSELELRQTLPAGVRIASGVNAEAAAEQIARLATGAGLVSPLPDHA